MDNPWTDLTPWTSGRKDAFLYVDNRLEGNAPSTIEAVLERLDGGIQHGPPY
jgi:hypothetical protein